MNILPQFKDMQVCAVCGAPAEIIGEAWERADGRDWYARPIEIPCHPRARGAEGRERQVPHGRTTRTETYHVRVYTHVCTRNAGSDPDGKASDAPEHVYECGALQRGMTRRVSPSDLPERCFDSEAVRPVDTAGFAGRWAS